MPLSNSRLARPSLVLILIGLFAATLWLAGGASRADAMGQVVVRGAAWSVLVVAVLALPRPRLDTVRPVALLLGAAALLALAQLVPLPPGLWQALPGRALFVQAALVAAEPQPWRPWAIVPDATANALAALIVPATMLTLLASLHERDKPRMIGVTLAMVVASTVVGLLQFSGTAISNPLVNDTVGLVSGTFANRNHFALFETFGCLLAPAWAYRNDRRPGWRAPLALVLVLLFVLAILATGSRTGMAIGVLALVIGLGLVRNSVRRTLRRSPPWAFQAVMTGTIALVAILVLASVAADRAVSIQRAFTVDMTSDMRARALPTVLGMVRTYFPWGSGLGGFDPVFRIHEPFALLKPTYFNHAHNDVLEVVLDAGLPGLLLLVASLGWWVVTSVRAWRAPSGMENVMPRIGSAMLLFVLMASLFDYPARTPLMMATMIVAAVWLAGAARPARSALPEDGRPL